MCRRVIAEAAADDAGHHGRDQAAAARRFVEARCTQCAAGLRAAKHGEAIFGEPIPTSGTPLYTDVRLYAAAGVPAAIYGAGPRTVFESNAKRADEHIVLEDLRRATKVVARTLLDLLG
jgi:acetylornithine deacetylase/succinyl-diaminopimelate desuccinylase-like protein